MTTAADELTSVLNDDLKDLLHAAITRSRAVFDALVDYAIANPTQGSALTAQSAVSSAFRATYPSGRVVGDLADTDVLQAFIARHGGAGTANERWVRVRDWIVAHRDFRDTFLEHLEAGAMPSIADLWHQKMTVAAPADAVQKLTRRIDVPVTDPTYGLEHTETVSSASLGRTIRRLWTVAVRPDGSVERTPGAWEVVA